MRLLSQRSISFAACKLVHTGESGWRARRVKARGQARAQVRGLQRTRGYRWITHPLSYSRWEGYQWIELNEYIKVTGCPREVTNTVNVGDGVKTLFICNWQVLKQLLLSG